MERRFIGIDRMRIGVDGKGVTTLAAFHGCALTCKYCLNKRALQENVKLEVYTPEELFEKLKIDDLYFVATDGGVTFGGGEPLLYPRFILQFRQYCGLRWKINVETSLHADSQAVRLLAQDIDHWIVDIKDMNPQIYKEYTSRDNQLMMDNLKILVDCGAKITARVPIIPEYNTQEDVDRSIAQLRQMGITGIDSFTYTIKS